MRNSGCVGVRVLALQRGLRVLDHGIVMLVRPSRSLPASVGNVEECVGAFCNPLRVAFPLVALSYHLYEFVYEGSCFGISLVDCNSTCQDLRWSIRTAEYITLDVHKANTHIM